MVAPTVRCRPGRFDLSVGHRGIAGLPVHACASGAGSAGNFARRRYACRAFCRILLLKRQSQSVGTAPANRRSRCGSGPQHPAPSAKCRPSPAGSRGRRGCPFGRHRRHGAEVLSAAIRRFRSAGSETAGLRVVHANQPNPWLDRTHIRFYLPEAGEVTLTVFDPTGRQVFSQTSAFGAGFQSIGLDGAALPAGLSITGWKRRRGAPAGRWCGGDLFGQIRAGASTPFLHLQKQSAQPCIRKHNFPNIASSEKFNAYVFAWSVLFRIIFLHVVLLEEYDAC